MSTHPRNYIEQSEAAIRDNQPEDLRSILKKCGDPSPEFHLVRLFAHPNLTPELAKILLEEKPKLINMFSRIGTPVFYAATSGNVAVVKLLVESGARLKVIPGHEKLGSVLVRVIHAWQLPRHVKKNMIDYLLQQDCGLNEPVYDDTWCYSDTAMTPLHWACECLLDEEIGVIQNLLSAGADPTIPCTTYGRLPLQAACRRENLDFAKLLVGTKKHSDHQLEHSYYNAMQKMDLRPQTRQRLTEYFSGVIEIPHEYQQRQNQQDQLELQEQQQPVQRLEQQSQPLQQQRVQTDVMIPAENRSTATQSKPVITILTDLIKSEVWQTRHSAFKSNLENKKVPIGIEKLRAVLKRYESGTSIKAEEIPQFLTECRKVAESRRGFFWNFFIGSRRDKDTDLFYQLLSKCNTIEDLEDKKTDFESLSRPNRPDAVSNDPGMKN